MERAPRSIDVEVLLAQSHWMAGLVRGLLKDQDAVEDVVQETWLRALEHAPRAEGGLASLRAWLAQVARRIALRRIESDEARRRREAEVAREESCFDPELATERLRLQRELANHVLALGEPYRTAVVLRYQEGLATSEIAERLRISEPAARQRVSRAVRQLRERLDRDHDGDRAAWCGAYALILRAPMGEAAAAVPVAGATGVATWIGALALVLSLAAAAWHFTRPSPSAPEPSAAATIPSGAEHDPIRASEAPAATHREVALAQSGATESAGENEAHAIAAAPLRGTVVIESGAPAGGATIEVFAADRSTYDLAQPAPDPVRAVVARARTDAAGSFEVAVAAGRLYDMCATAEGFAPAWLADRCAGETVTIALAKPASVEGRITRERDGTPVAAARIRAVRLWMDSARGSYREVQRTETDGDGRYRLDLLEPGRVSIEVVAERDSDLTTVLDIEAGAALVRDWTLARGQVVRGTVSDELTGLPIAGASVVAGPAHLAGGRAGGALSPAVAGRGWKCRRPVSTGAQGEFEVVVSADFVPSQIVASAPGYGAESVRVNAAAEGSLQLEIALARGATLRGRTLAPDGAPLSGVRVVAAARTVAGGIEHVDWREALSTADGAFEVGGLRRDREHVLAFDAAGSGREEFVIPAEALRAGEVDLGAIALGRASRIAGLVLDGSGEPQRGVWVTLTGGNDDAERFGGAANPATVALISGLGQRSLRTDDAGRFLFDGLCGGGASSWRVHTAGAADVDLASEGSFARDDVRLIRTAPGAIAGIVVDLAGEPLQNACVVLRSEDDANARPVAQVTRADGRFRFEGVGAGAYQLAAAPNSIHAEGGDRMVHAVEIDALRAGADELEIVLPPAAATTGRVVDEHGGPAAHAMVFARDAAGELVTYEEAGSDGSFVLRLPPGSTADLYLEASGARPALQGVRAGARDVLVTTGAASVGSR